MDKKNIIDRHLHSKIFDFLSKRHLSDKKDKTNYFRLRRTNRYNRLSEGFWFHGTEKYLSLSFWTGSDWKNKTPRISFVFSPNGSIWLELAAKESAAHFTFYTDYLIEPWKEEFPKSRGFNTFENKTGDKELYSKKLDYAAWNHDNILEILIKILKKEKSFIDKQIEKYRLTFLSSITGVNFIKEQEFNTLRDNIIQYRDVINEREKKIDIILGGITYSDIVEVDDTPDRGILHESLFKENVDERPLSVQELEVIKYKALENIKISNIGKDVQWVFFTGENGCGKTSMLEALAISMNGNEDGNVLLCSNDFEINARFFNESMIGKQKHKRIDGRDKSKFVKIDQFACYGPNRFDISSNSTITDIDHSGKTYNLFHNDGKLLSIEEAMIKWDFKRTIYLEESIHYNSSSRVSENRLYQKYEKYVDLYLNVKEILLGSEGSKIDSDTLEETENLMNKGFLPEVTDMKPIDDRDDDKMYYFIGNNEDRPLRFNQLSTGNKSLLALVGDLILRFIEYSEETSFIDPSKFEGIVLIDEIDAHIHPEWQYQIPSILSEAFPKIQFIATCHSPIPILGVKEGSKRAAYFRFFLDEQMRPKVEEVRIETSQLTPGSILSSPIFNFRKFLSPDYKYEEGFHPSDDYEEVVFSKVLKQRIQDLDTEYKENEED